MKVTRARLFFPLFLCLLTPIASLSSFATLAAAQTTAPAPNSGPAKPAPSTPESKAPPSATPPAPAPDTVTPGTKTSPPTPATPDARSPATSSPPAAPGTAPAPKPDGKDPSKESTKEPDDADADAPPPKPGNTEIEPHSTPQIPQNATTESLNVTARPIVEVSGRSPQTDAFKSIKGSIETVKKAMEKAGLKAAGRPITIFSDADDKSFKYRAAVPIVSKPDGKKELGDNVTIDESPAGKAIKFQHRGPYEDIDATYEVITAYLDAKGLQVDNNPYVEEYLTDLTTPDDPNLQVDIYIFVKP